MGQMDAAVADMERFLQLTDNEGWRAQGESLLQQWRLAAAPDEEQDNVDQDS